MVGDVDCLFTQIISFFPSEYHDNVAHEIYSYIHVVYHRLIITLVD